jgi:hypothetical protein
MPQSCAATGLAPLEIDLVEERRIGLRHAVSLDDDDLVDQDQHADGADKRCQRAVEWHEAEIEHVDGIADDPARQHAGHKDADCRHRHHGRDRPARIGSGDRGRGVGQIDLVHDAEDHREADADDGVGRAEQHPVGDR